MLDQNVTTLIATLIGGSLSLLGVFLANYYTQSTSKKADKQKGIRNMIESIYRELQSMEDAYDTLLELQKEYFKDKTGPLYENYDAYSAQKEQITFERNVTNVATQMKGGIKKMDLLVTLYLSPLLDNFKKYRNKIYEFVETTDFENPNIGGTFSKQDLEEISNGFKKSLSDLLREKGYSYL